MSAIAIAEAGQFLTFYLDDEVFALPINKVREVLDFTSITKVPQTPDFMLGVINLRGNVVPVMDLRLKFGLSRTVRTVNTCIIITEIAVEGETLLVGALTDSVKEVMELGADQIEPPPRLGTRLNTRFIRGMGKRDAMFIIIIDIDQVLSSEELQMVEESERRQAV
jgi:purine-binding chemotaxis protein CheW